MPVPFSTSACEVQHMVVFVRPDMPHSMLVLSMNSSCEVQHVVQLARPGISHSRLVLSSNSAPEV